MNRMLHRAAQLAAPPAMALAALAAFSALKPAPASAQVAYGSYVGVGVAVPITSDAVSGQSGGIQGMVQGRYRFLTSPLSLRGQAYFFGSSFAFVPSVSYDIPLNWNLDTYVGVGVSFVGGGDEPTVLGDQTALVLQSGVDYVFPNSNLVAFGSGTFAINSYSQGGNSAVSISGGMGIQF